MSTQPQVLTGLTLQEVEQKTNAGQVNTLPARPSRTLTKILINNVFNPYNLVLASSVVVLMILNGSKNILFSTMLLFANILIGLVQELRAKRTLDKLAALRTHQVTVRREGKAIVIPIDEIVLDDLIELHPGDQIVVDGPLLESNALEIDESSLTGESEYVSKNIKDHLLSGSFCVAGSGVQRATKIGPDSYLHQFVKKARMYRSNKTPLERRLQRILRLLLIGTLILGPLTIISGINFQLTFAQTIENVVNLLISLIPQGLIATITILYAYGAIRITRMNALVQRMNAIGSMGHITVLCTDKTGTLTTNALTLEKIQPLNLVTPTELEHKLQKMMAVVDDKNRTALTISKTLGIIKISAQKIAEIPFQSQRKWSGVTLDTNETYLLGAPELFLSTEQIEQYVHPLSHQGFRVLAFAESKTALDGVKKQLPEQFTVLGILALQDELRSDVVETLAKLTKLRIKLKVISGDHQTTLQAIALQTGLGTLDVVTQVELEQMDKGTFDRAVKQHVLFARITPQMKAQIVSSLIKQGMHVGMVGDGVNDVPALKQAKVSIAMNAGAQITKDVADVILLKNSFALLPEAIGEGREILQRIYAVAKIFFVKVVYLTVLFVLTSVATLSFPLTLGQTTWLGFMMTGVPTFFICLKVLRPNSGKTQYKNFINYCLATGIMGGVLLTITIIVSTTVLNENPEVTQTMVTIVAALYSMLILLDIHGISFLRLRTYLKNLGSALIILCIGIISILLPFYFGDTFSIFVPIALVDWVMIGAAFTIAVFLLNFDAHRLTPRAIFQFIWRDDG